MKYYYVGIDIGERRDYTAIAVVERLVYLEGEGWISHAKMSVRQRILWDRLGYRDGCPAYLHRRSQSHFRAALRHLRRLSLGTDYATTGKTTQEILEAINQRADVIIDETVIGNDLAKTIYPKAYTVTTTAGTESSKKARLRYNVPRRDLVQGLNALLEQKRLHIASNMALAATLVEEMQKVKIKAPSRDDEVAWREGAHDDLVLAVALACWRMKIYQPMSVGFV